MWNKIKSLLGRFFGPGRASAPAPRPVQEVMGELSNQGLDPVFRTQGTKSCPRRQHHSRGNRDQRGHR
jgi:hypothetical protein